MGEKMRGKGVETRVGDIKSHDIEHGKGEASGTGLSVLQDDGCGQSHLHSSQVIAHSRSAL